MINDIIAFGNEESAKILTKAYKGCEIKHFECTNKSIIIHFTDGDHLTIGE